MSFFFLSYFLHCPKRALIFYLTEGHFRRVTHASPIVYGWGCGHSFSLYVQYDEHYRSVKKKKIVYIDPWDLSGSFLDSK